MRLKAEDGFDSTGESIILFVCERKDMKWPDIYVCVWLIQRDVRRVEFLIVLHAAPRGKTEEKNKTFSSHRRVSEAASSEEHHS